MTDTVVRAYVIGQSPRPDLTRDLESRFPGVAFDVVGALDGLEPEAVPACAGCAYPLETRLRDGTRVVIDASCSSDRIQDAIDEYQGDAVAHLVLCAGPFPRLRVSTGSGPGPALIRPFETGAQRLRALGHDQLEVVVPFTGQADPARAKWSAEGFEIRTHALSQRPHDTPLPDWLSGQLRDRGADAVVFDYVGFPSDALRDVTARIELPVFDLGHLALDALQEMLDMRSDR